MSKDPGGYAFYARDKNVLNNMGRQLLSTKNGLKHANRKYIMKLRSDLILTSAKFLEQFDKYPARCAAYRLFNHRILISSLFSRFALYRTRRNNMRWPIVFHPSDCWLFGLNEDVKMYFAAELPKEPDFSTYFAKKENLNTERPFAEFYCQFFPEQYFCYKCFSKYFPEIQMKDYSVVTEAIIRQSRVALVNNFTMLDFEDSGIFLNKYLCSKKAFLVGGGEYFNIYNKDRYEIEYRKYCDCNFALNKDNIYQYHKRALINLRRRLWDVYRHIFWLLHGQNRVRLLFIVLPVAIMLLASEILSFGLHKIKGLFAKLWRSLYNPHISARL
jgi:hypothetical protein